MIDIIISIILVILSMMINSVKSGGTQSRVDLNPPIVISPVTVDKRKFNIVRDDYLPGGTKQRIMEKVLVAYDEFVYAGPIYGYAQIALAYAASVLGKSVTIFVETKVPLYPQTQKAKDYGAKIMNVGRAATLKDVQAAAEKYVKGRPKAYLIPFGFHTPEYIDLLSAAITSAWKGPAPKRMWVAAGSATLLNALYKSFPDTYFLAVQVGKTVWPDQIDAARSKLFVSDEKFWEVAKIQPPYPTVKTYDAKVWKFVLEHGETDDYVWNVAGEN